MKRIGTLLLLVAMVMSSATVAFAAGDAGAACGAAGCGILGIVWILIYILIIAACLAVPILIICLVIKFIKNDAVAHGMPNADSIKWLGLLGLLGLLIYLLQRPSVPVMLCPTCGKNRMQGLPVCPHCGNP
jgi:hypothetical protein